MTWTIFVQLRIRPIGNPSCCHSAAASEVRKPFIAVEVLAGCEGPIDGKCAQQISYVMEPDGEPIGVVVLLHGLTDSPYSLRHIAKRYRDRGFVAIGVRLPGHGTVPAGLTDVRWEDWMAATGLAVREARRRVPVPAPLHLVGFSNGGALAMKYSLDALERSELARADRLLLLYADDRHNALCALCRVGGPASRAASVCSRSLAQRLAGVQPIQVQLVSGQRRASVLPADRSASRSIATYEDGRSSMPSLVPC